jgi:formylglycine-generating enzyme required for sulfatase activity
MKYLKSFVIIIIILSFLNTAYTNDDNSNFVLNLKAGWNLVAIPLIPNDNRVMTLIPDAIVVYEYDDGGYIKATEMIAGKGYWVMIPEDRTYEIWGEVFGPMSVAEHEWIGTGLSFKNPDGTWGPVVDLKGDQGEKGEKGEKGDTGSIGPKGEPGEKGDIGPKGDIGLTGPKGEQGLPPEHRWDETFLKFKKPDGSWGNPVNLRGQRGEQGEPGPKGEQGNTGPKGEKGDKGAKGDQGVSGPKGEQGIPGPKGEQGIPGSKGNQGVTGPKGDPGEILKLTTAERDNLTNPAIGTLVFNKDTNCLNVFNSKTWIQLCETRRFHDFTNSVGMNFVYITPGTFLMGSPNDEYGRHDNEVQRQVTLSNPYYLQTTEVTQKQWKTIMGSNPSYYSSCGDDCPVEQVNWEDIQQFIRSLNQREKTNKYRLPTEAEWEYAARAGTTTAFYNGGINKKRRISKKHCESNPNLNAIAWNCGNSGAISHPVAQKQPNAWGLYDMTGNLWEWCQDWYSIYSSNPVINPTGPTTGTARVLRGGNYVGDIEWSRIAIRIYYKPDIDRFRDYGFRVLREP